MAATLPAAPIRGVSRRTSTMPPDCLRRHAADASTPRALGRLRCSRSPRMLRRLADAGAAGRHHRLAGRRRRGPPSRSTACRFLWRSEWDPVNDKFGGAGADLRHAGHLGHRAADRRAGELRHRAVPHRTLARLAAPAAGHRRRTAGRDSVDHLRHVGPVRVRRRSSPTIRAAAAAALRSATVPLLGALFPGAPMGIGILSAGIILAIMIIPFIASVMRDVFETTPPMLKESAYGLGSTTWEVVLERRAAVHQDGRHRRRSCSASAARSARRWR